MGKISEKLRTRGPKIGYCVICSVYGELTHDHIPPKGSTKITAVEMRTLTQHISKETTKYRESLNGVKFRTICQKCNNELLGHEYDPHLNQISKEVSSEIHAVYESKMLPPPKLSVTVSPQRVARSIIGHVLASIMPTDINVPPISAPFPDAMRQYFLDPKQPLPSSLEIYYWVYPSYQQTIIRGAAVGSLNPARFIVGDIIKFYPLAYWLVWERPHDAVVPFDQLLPNKTVGLDEKREIFVTLRDIPSVQWPESPNSKGLLIFRDESTAVSRPRSKPLKPTS